MLKRLITIKNLSEHLPYLQQQYGLKTQNVSIYIESNPFVQNILSVEIKSTV